MLAACFREGGQRRVGNWANGFYHVLKWRQEDRGRDGLMMRDGRSFVTERRNLATGLVMGAEIL